MPRRLPAPAALALLISQAPPASPALLDGPAAVVRGAPPAVPDAIAELARRRALDLKIDTWSASFDLPDTDPCADPPEVRARLRSGRSALQFELVIDHFEPTRRTPWRGGSGVFVTVIKPDTADGGSGAEAAEFAFGLFMGKAPIGAVRNAGRWRPAAELTPVFGIDGATGLLSMTFAVPWSSCGGVHPLADATIGLNIMVVRQGGALLRCRASWLAAPAGGGRRYGVPVHMRWRPESGPAVHARPADPVLRHRVLEVSPLSVVWPDSSPAPVSLELRDRHGAAQHRTSWTLEGPPGRRERHGVLEVDLPAGSAVLEASIEDPAGGKAASWQVDLVSIPEQWTEMTPARLAVLPARERFSLQHRFDAVVAEAEERLGSANPARLGAEVDEIDRLLDIFAATGTSVPAGGHYLAAMPTEHDVTHLPISLHLPDRWRRGDPVRALVLMMRASDGQTQAVKQAPQLLAGLAADLDGPPPAVVLAIPHLGDRQDDDLDHEAALIGHLVAWLRDFLGCGPVHLAGVDLLAAAVLETAAARRDDLAGILMITGMNFIPYPGEDAGALAARVSGLDPDLPAGWIWFPEEQKPDDQAAALRGALDSAGVRLHPSRLAHGSLTFDQAWQRALHWVVQPVP